jgi:hypothetical protein
MHHEDERIFFLNLTGILGGGRRGQVLGIRLRFVTTRQGCFVNRRASPVETLEVCLHLIDYSTWEFGVL